MAKEKTDAEKLADALAGMQANAEAAKAARLPSASAAKAFLETPEATAFASALDALIASNIDDVTGGCKRSLERIRESIAAASGIAIQRIAALQPSTSETATDALPVSPAPAEA